MKYNFDVLPERKDRYSIRWELEMLGPFMGLGDLPADALPVFNADMDFPCAEPIVEALHEMADKRFFGYHLIPPNSPYMKAVTAWFKRQFDWEVSPSDIFPGGSVLDTIRRCLNGLIEPGDGVLIQRPAYNGFPFMLTSAGAVIVESPLLNDGTGYYTVDWEDFEKKCAMPSTKVFLLCSPQNPTGRVFTEEELKKMAEICRRHQVVIIADEIHGELVRKDQKFIPIAKAAGPQGIITCTALNKTFSIAGIEASNMIIEDQELKMSIIQHIFAYPNMAAIYATVGAYSDGGAEWLEQLNAYLDETVEWVMKAAAEKLPKVVVKKPEGTYMLWMDFSKTGLTEDEIHDRIYNQAHVILEDGKAYDETRCRLFQRMALCSPRYILEDAFERLGKVFADVM